MVIHYLSAHRALCSEVPYYLSDLTQALAEDMGAKVIGHLTRGHGSESNRAAHPRTYSLAPAGCSQRNIIFVEATLRRAKPEDMGAETNIMFLSWHLFAILLSLPDRFRAQSIFEGPYAETLMQ